AVDGDLVARVCVTHHPGAGIVPQHAFQAAVGGLAAVAHDHHAGVLGVAHAHAAAVVPAEPGRAAGDVAHGVEQRPVADRVAAVAHGLGLAAGAGDAGTVQMIAAAHPRGLEFAIARHLVEREAQAVAVTEADPADPRRQALEADAFLRHVEPAVQVRDRKSTRL